MKTTTLSLIQLAWSGSIESMQDQYRQLIPQAVEQGAQVVCLPEFSLIPYFPGTRDEAGFAYAEDVRHGVSSTFFAEMAAQHQVYVMGSLYEVADGLYYDTATIHAPNGELVGITRKIHIPSGDGYHETDFFGGGADYPVWSVGELQVATPTCYDQWFPELARIFSMNGAELIYYPTAIGSEPNDPEMDSSTMWQTVMRGHAIANGIFVAATNRVGHENAVTFYGSSFICDPMGTILAQAGRDTTEVITATLDEAVFTRWRGLFPLLQQRKPHTYARLLEQADGALSERFQAHRKPNE
ncbi:MAG: nitrilase-related carbon-nitrogen hydrolase [Phototrophicaceae bacterium]